MKHKCASSMILLISNIGFNGEEKFTMLKTPYTMA